MLLGVREIVNGERGPANEKAVVVVHRVSTRIPNVRSTKRMVIARENGPNG